MFQRIPITIGELKPLTTVELRARVAGGGNKKISAFGKAEIWKAENWNWITLCDGGEKRGPSPPARQSR
jgi:hypothetical protein